MKKILILVNHSITVYNFRYELVERFRDDGYEVYISSPNGEKIKCFTDMGCNFIETAVSRHGTNPIADAKLCFNYLRLMKTVKPDVVLSYTIKPNIYGGLAAAICKIPFMPNVTGLGIALKNDGAVQRLVKMLYKAALKKVTCVFFENNENELFFRDNGLFDGYSRVLPGAGVNLEKFIPTEYPDTREVNFVFISRVMRDKGINEYLECARQIKAVHRNVNFHIYVFCEDDWERRLKDYADCVEYHGWIDDTRGVLEGCSAIIHPSYHEGMSNVLLEASACARPCICSDIAGCREIVDDGKSGFLFKAADVQSMICAVEKFLALTNEQRRLMGLYAAAKVAKEFDRQLVVRAYIEEINKITKEHC